MKLFKVRTNNLHALYMYILAEDLNDCIYKARKYYESLETIYDLEIQSIEMLSKNPIL